MAINLNREGVALNGEERNKRNQNWVTIEENINSAAADYTAALNYVSEKAYSDVLDASKLEWQEPVATFADLATTYPDATEAFTSQTTSDGFVYRFNGSEWKKIQQVDAGPINEVDTRLTAQLADKAGQEELERISIPNQIDFVADLQKLASNNRNMSVQFKGVNVKAVNIRLSKTKGVVYEFSKNTNDDYFIALGGSIGTINELYAVTDQSNPDTITGTFDQQYPPNYFTTEVGARIHKVFEGTKITHYSWKESRGGLWRYTLNPGTAGERTKDISVYAAATSYVEQTIFDNLPYGKHTVVGEFIGADPANPVASPRGWIYYGGVREQDTKRTFNVYNDTFEVVKTVDALYSYSNKEFAFNIRPVGSTADYQWIPEHSSIGTAFKVNDMKMYADGVEVPHLSSTFLVDVEVFQMVQKVRGYHSSAPSTALMEITTYHTIKDGVLSVSGKVEFLQDTDVWLGYTLMFPYWATDFGKKIKTSLENVYGVITDNPSYKEYWADGEKSLSFAVLNDVDAGDKMNTVTAMTIDNYERTMRVGADNRGNPLSWIEHRNSAMGKLYFAQFQNTIVPAGYEYRFGGRYIATMVQDVSGLML